MGWLREIDESISTWEEAAADVAEELQEVSQLDTVEHQQSKTDVKQLEVKSYDAKQIELQKARKPYKKSVEEIINILNRADEVGLKQAARELGVTRNDISCWKRMFLKRIREQIPQGNSGIHDIHDVHENVGADSPYSSWRQVSAEQIIAYADEVGDEQAVLEFKISVATMRNLRKRTAATPKTVKVKGHTIYNIRKN